MAKAVGSRSVVPSFLEVRQRVRRYRPSDLLPAVARVACDISDREADSFERWRGASPWGLALLARESVLRATTYRPARRVTDSDVLELLNLLNVAHDKGPQGERDRALGVLARAAYEQFPYQESDAEELARSWALLHDANAQAETGLTASDVDELVGGPLKDILRATWLVYGLCRSSGGLWDEAFWSTAEAQELTESTSCNHVLRVASELTADLATMRRDHATVSPPPRHLLRYDYNPLHKTPLALLEDGRVLAPQPRLILRSMSPSVLYYKGLERFGPMFPGALGKVVEGYVGMNVRCVQDSHVEGEIIYDKDSKRSVDWLWQLPGLLVLIEVKAMRATMAARIGAPEFAPDLAKRLNDAANQLRRTNGLINDGHAAFRHLPRSAMRIGLIVTAEPIYVGNASIMRQYLSEANMPTLVVSLRELEDLVAHDAEEVAAALRRIATSPRLSTWLFSSALRHVFGDSSIGRGPLVVKALERIKPDFSASDNEERAARQRRAAL